MEFSTLIVLIGLAAAIYWFLRRRSRRLNVDHMPEQCVVIDLETTGLDPTKHEIIEIAAIRYRRGQERHQTLQALIKPRQTVPAKITELTGITQEMVETQGEELGKALRELTVFLGESRVVSFNAEFDIGFIQVALAQHSLPPMTNSVSCALKMSRRAWPRRKSYKLVDLVADGKIGGGQAHRALEDARRALVVYAAAVSELKSVD